MVKPAEFARRLGVPVVTSFMGRGLLADRLLIDSRDDTTLDIVINGIVAGRTGVDAIAQIGLTPDFTALSSVNGCVIAAVASCGVTPPPPPPPPKPPGEPEPEPPSGGGYRRH